MDSRTINKICSTKPLSTFFIGLVTFEEICSGKQTFKGKICDFLIINVRDAHWITLTWCTSTKVILFDSLFGRLTLPKTQLKKVIFSNFPGINNVVFQYGNGKLQDPEFLSCGEQTVYFVYYQVVFYLNNGVLDENYIAKIINYCKKNHIYPDQFVWQEIYVDMNLAKPPNLHKILTWIDRKKI